MDPRKQHHDDAPLDWRRYGRQIALPELGEVGQSRLARTPVAILRASTAAADARHHDAASALAAALYARAGGRLAQDADADAGTVALRVPALPDRADPCGALVLGAAAACAMEAARRALGRPPREVPPELLARLAPPERAP